MVQQKTIKRNDGRESRLSVLPGDEDVCIGIAPESVLGSPPSEDIGSDEDLPVFQMDILTRKNTLKVLEQFCEGHETVHRLGIIPDVIAQPVVPPALRCKVDHLAGRDVAGENTVRVSVCPL